VLEAARLGRSRERRGSGRTILEGPVLVGEAVSAGHRLERVFALTGDRAAREAARMAGCPLHPVGPEVLARPSTTDHPQTPVAVLVVPPPSARTGVRALVAWGLGDPGNCGTLIRTAAAFGYDYIAGPESAETWSPKVLRAATGGHFHTGIGLVDGIDRLREGRTLVATVPRGGGLPGPLPPNAAILIGSEPHGLPDEVVAACDLAVTVPMAGAIESLNAAVAGAIVAFIGASGPRANLATP